MTQRKKTHIPILVVVLGLLVCASGCQKAPHPPDDPFAARIDTLFREWDTLESPGAAVAVLRDGNIVFSRGYGIAQLEYGVPITPDTIFHVASVSKQFTAFAVTLLAQQGALSLDDDIRKYLPEVPDFGSIITLRHLIHHTSGLRDQWEALAMAGWRLDDVITREHILTMVQHQRELNFEPGEEHLYCNTGYTLLGEIVARVTGVSFAAWTKNNLFEPLGMNHTHFHDSHELIVPERAYSYKPEENGDFHKSVLSYANAGATSLFTTVGDLLKWASNFMDPRVGTPEIMAQMQELAVLNSGREIPYGFGLGIRDHRGVRMISHGGADAGFRTWLGIFPDQKFAVSVLSNLGSMGPNRLGELIAEMYLEEDLLPAPEKKGQVAPPGERKVAEVDPMNYEIFVGTYGLDDGTRLEIIKEEDRLFAVHPARGKVELFPEAMLRYFVKGEDLVITFHPDNDYYVESLTVLSGGQNLEGKRTESLPLSEAQIGAIEGVYTSEELMTSYSLRFRDGRLAAHHFRHGEIPLIWTEKDTFTGRRWYFRRLVFQRDGAGRIQGFLLTGGRVWNLRFDKK